MGVCRMSIPNRSRNTRRRKAVGRHTAKSLSKVCADNPRIMNASKLVAL